MGLQAWEIQNKVQQLISMAGCISGMNEVLNQDKQTDRIFDGVDQLEIPCPIDLQELLNNQTVSDLNRWVSAVTKHIYRKYLNKGLSFEACVILPALGIDINGDYWGKTTTFENDELKLELTVDTRYGSDIGYTSSCWYKSAVTIKTSYGTLIYNYDENLQFEGFVQRMADYVKSAKDHAQKYMRRKREVMLKNIHDDCNVRIHVTVPRHSWNQLEYMNRIEKIEIEYPDGKTRDMCLTSIIDLGQILREEQQKQQEGVA